MKFSQLHTPPQKSDKIQVSVNANLLIKAGFIHQVMAGVYTFLPLGLRVLNKIEAIVREEMDTVGTEILMSALAPPAVWQTTGRLDSIDVLMKTAGANALSCQKNTSEYILNCTHEDNITPLIKQYAQSYKDLPVALYQIQSKFRNEARAKSGLLRGREFRMKDLYSFHASREDFQEFYEAIKPVYSKIFSRIGLGEKTVIALASGGDFTKDYSHEFQTRCETGEDLIFHAIKNNIYYNKEVTPCLAPATLQDAEQKPTQKIHTPNAKTMEQLVPMLKIAKEQCVKTIIYETADSQVIAAAVRGDRQIDEGKLSRIIDKKLKLASSQTILNATGAEVGYAGLVDLKPTVKLVVDDSVAPLINFESGANQTDYHWLNLNWGRDLKKPKKFYDIKIAKPGDIDPQTKKVYPYFKASEVGNIFPLGNKFPNAFAYTYTDKSGQKKPVFMGSYGIGTSRLMGVIVEIFHDEKGIIWPKSVAPYQVHLISIGQADDKTKALYEKLLATNCEVLWDDRDVSAGSKFADADLIGCPIRLVVSAKTGQNIEWKTRVNPTTELLSQSAVIARLIDAKTTRNI